jgi:tetratricopeptide (TPR) repeat protein
MGPIVSTRPGRGMGNRPGGRNNGGYNSGRQHYGRGSAYYGGRLCWDYCRPAYAYCYPWRRYRPWYCSTWGNFWGYYSWPRYCYSSPYWGGGYSVYSNTVYVYTDEAIEAGYYDPIDEVIPVGDVTGAGGVPVEEVPADSEPGSDDLTLARHYSSLGDLYMRTRRYSRALDSYQRAVKFAPEDGSLRFVLADALFQTGKLDECSYQIRKGLALDPSLAIVEVDKRSFFDWPEDFDKEVSKLEKMVAAAPFQANLRLVLAYNYRMTKRYADARKELTTLSEQLPGDKAITLMLEGLNELPATK